MADLFSDGFESGNLTAWDSNENDDGDLSVTEEAKLHGDYGLSVLIDDQSNIYVRDDTPSNETRYRFRVYIDPNNITMANTKLLLFMKGFNASASGILYVELYKSGDDYKIKARIRDDGGTYNPTSGYVITDEPHCIEIDWMAATGDGNDDGYIELFIDGVSKEKLDGIDNDTKSVHYIWIGGASVTTDIEGTFFLDDFASNDDGSEIGLIGGETQALISTAAIAISTVSALSRGITEVLTSTSNIATSITSAISRGVTEVLTSTTNMVSSITGSLTRGVKETLASTSAIVTSITSSLSRGVTETLTSISNITTSFASALSRGITEVLTSTSNIATSIVSVLTIGGIKALNSTVNIVSSITSKLIAIYNWVKVIKITADGTIVEKEKDDWTKVSKEEGDWIKVDKE